jgi:hypothetical protein
VRILKREIVFCFALFFSCGISSSGGQMAAADNDQQHRYSQGDRPLLRALRKQSAAEARIAQALQCVCKSNEAPLLC